MSNIFLTDDEIKDFVKDVQEDIHLRIGHENEEMGVCPYITFYVFHTNNHFEKIASKFIYIYEKFTQLIDEPIQHILIENKDESHSWVPANSKCIPKDWYKEIKRCKKINESFIHGASGGEYPSQSAKWAIMSSTTEAGVIEYSYLKISFDDTWYKNNKETWHAFVQLCLQELQPEHCYSGYEIGNTTHELGGSLEHNVMERIMCDYFYGLDIDHAEKLIHHYRNQENMQIDYTLAAGIRTPVWSFLLSSYWLEKLGKSIEEVKVELDDPRIVFTHIENPTEPDKPSVWIQLGDLALYPVEEGVPDLLVKANKLIKPIRANNLELTALDPWDFDENPCFDDETSPLWIARFDEDSTWPEDKRLSKGG